MVEVGGEYVKRGVKILIYTIASVNIFIQTLHLMHPRIQWGTGGPDPP